MLKEKQEGNDGGGAGEERMINKGSEDFILPSFCPHYLWVFKESSEYDDSKKSNKKQNWMFLVAYFKEKRSGFWDVEQWTPRQISETSNSIWITNCFYLWQLSWGWSVKYSFEIYLLGFQNHDTSTAHLSWSKDAAPGDRVCVCPWK